MKGNWAEKLKRSIFSKWCIWKGNYSSLHFC